MSGFQWILCGIGGFYAALALAFLYLNSKPSCRVCVYWQTCLPTRLGLTTEPPRRCATISGKVLTPYSVK
jgi:hypothetical protein